MPLDEMFKRSDELVEAVRKLIAIGTQQGSVGQGVCGFTNYTDDGDTGSSGPWRSNNVYAFGNFVTAESDAPRNNDRV